MSTKPLPLGPHQAYPNPPGNTNPYIPASPNPWGDPRQEVTPVAFPPPAPYVPPDSPYTPNALGQPASDTSPVFVATEDAITSSYVKGPAVLGQTYPPGGILVEAPNPWDSHPDNPAQPVVIDGVPQIDIWGDPNSVMGPNPPPLNLDYPNAPEEPPLDEGAPAINPVDTTATGVDGTFLDQTFWAASIPDTAPAAVVTDPTAAAVLDPNAAPAAVTSGSAISGWWLIAIAIGVWYFWFRKGKK